MTFDEHISFALDRGVPRSDLPARAPAFERRIGLVGNYNFRDAGGYAVADEGVMRRALVFRSDHMATLTDDDVEHVRSLGLRRIHDFRLESERERHPSRLPGGPDAPEVMLLGTSDFSGLDASFVDVIRDMLAGIRPLPEADFWEHNYLDMVANSQRMLVGFLRSIAQPNALPALHHCTGGKDRTGVSTALLHRVIGVADDDIMDDFLLTNLYRTVHRIDELRDGFAARGIDVANAVPILGVSRAPLSRVLDHWDRGGGASAYAIDGGATEAELRTLRETLVTSAGAAEEPKSNR